MGKVKINVSGTLFEVNSCLFEKTVNGQTSVGMLPPMVREAVQLGSTLEFQRPTGSFVAILEFYQTGELHMPIDVCPASFKKEMDFWQLDVSLLDICCKTRYQSFVEEQSLLGDFRKEVARNTDVTPADEIKTCRGRVWQVVDNRRTSIPAKVYFGLTVIAVVLSIAGITLGTDPCFKREASFCELLEYLEFERNPLYTVIRGTIGRRVCRNPARFLSRDGDARVESLFSGEDEFNYYLTVFTRANRTIGQRKEEVTHTIPKLFLTNYALVVIEYVTLGFFTIDFLLRIFTCPSLSKFIRSALNIIDAAALMGSYLNIIITQFQKQQKYETNWLDMLDFIQVFRALRLFRLVKHIRTSRVLFFAIRRYTRELSILALFLLIFICTFGSLIYFAESQPVIKSIPDGFWWSLVTMTTVGYGDIIPKSLPGRIVGSLCALTGIWLMSLTLPIFVNNFVALYRYPSHNGNMNVGTYKDISNDTEVNEQKK